MYSINPKGVVLFFLILLGGATIGVWSIMSGTLSFDLWKFRLNNVTREQQQLEEELEKVAQKKREVKEEITAVFDLLPEQLSLSKETKGDSAVLDTLHAYSLDEMVTRSQQDAQILHELLGNTQSDTAAWYQLPLGFPVPLVAPWYYKNEYGMITDPLTNEIRMHRGIDIAAQRETPVLVTGSGRVKRVKQDRFFGKMVVITHPFGYTTVYAHLGKTMVRRGDKVVRGDTLGLVGETGWTTSPLVHYEIQKDGESFDPTIILWYLNRS